MWWRLFASVVLLNTWKASCQLFDGLPNINPEKIANSLGDVNPSKVAKALQDAKIPKSVNIPDSVKAITPEKAVKVIQTAGTAKVSDVVGALEAAPKPNATHVGGKVSDTLHDTHQRTQNLVKELQKSLPKEVVDKVQLTDPQKVGKVLDVAGDQLVEALKHVNPQKVEEALNKDPHKIDHVLEAIETVDWWSTHWQWVLLFIVLMILTCVGIWHAYRTFLVKNPRSPNLLVDSEINMWVRPGGRQWQPPSAEEQGFRQF